MAAIFLWCTAKGSRPASDPTLVASWRCSLDLTSLNGPGNSRSGRAWCRESRMLPGHTSSLSPPDSPKVAASGWSLTCSLIQWHLPSQSPISWVLSPCLNQSGWPWVKHSKELRPGPCPLLLGPRPCGLQVGCVILPSQGNPELFREKKGWMLSRLMPPRSCCKPSSISILENGEE